MLRSSRTRPFFKQQETKESYIGLIAAFIHKMVLTRPGAPLLPNQCDFCNRTFSRTRDLRRHKLIHTPTNERFTYRCSVQGCHFSGAYRKDDLQKHMRKAHGMNTTKRRITQDVHQDAYKQSLKEQNSLGGCFNLLMAAELGSVRLVEGLLHMRPDMAMKSEAVSSALAIAVAKGHEAVVQLLLEKGADVQVNDQNVKEPLLWWAAGNGHEAVVSLLLEKGADVQAKAKTKLWHDYIGWVRVQTVLSRAAENGHMRIVELLLKNGAMVQAESPGDISALEYAIKNGHENIVRVLLENGADANRNDGGLEERWIEMAATYGHEPIIRLFFEKVADIQIYSFQMTEALRCAAREGHEAVVRLLLEKGAYIDGKNQFLEMTALGFAARNGHENIVQLLLKQGADVHARDKFGWTALSWAVKKKHEDIAQLLREKGADM